MGHITQLSNNSSMQAKNGYCISSTQVHAVIIMHVSSACHFATDL